MVYIYIALNNVNVHSDNVHSVLSGKTTPYLLIFAKTRKTGGIYQIMDVTQSRLTALLQIYLQALFFEKQTNNMQIQHV